MWVEKREVGGMDKVIEAKATTLNFSSDQRNYSFGVFSTNISLGELLVTPRPAPPFRPCPLTVYQLYHAYNFSRMWPKIPYSNDPLPVNFHVTKDGNESKFQVSVLRKLGFYEFT